MRTRIPFSAGWRFNLEGAELVDLPHTLVPLPENHFDEGRLFVQAHYFKEFDSPEHQPGGRVFLDFDGVAVSCSLWLNGKALGGHRGPYTPFSFDITDFLQPGRPNLLKILVSGREDPDIPPFGGVVDYLVPGGIYRGVWIRVQDRFWLEELFARPRVVEVPRGKAELEVEACVRGGDSPIPGDTVVEARLGKDGVSVAGASAPAKECVDESGRLRLKFPALSGVELWDCDSPNLYSLSLTLGEFDRLSARIGFRTARFTDKGFFLNGERVF
ncbi:MAG: beta-galactosidase, partial [Spirochaetes bacterium]